MTDTAQIQNTPSANDFIVPAEVESAAAAKITPLDDVVVEDAVSEQESEKSPEALAAEKAAAKEAFRRRKAEREAEGASSRVAELEAQVRELAAAKANPKSEASAAPKRPNPADYELGRWDAKYEADKEAYEEARESYLLAQAEEKVAAATRNLSENAVKNQELHNLEDAANKVGERGVDKYDDFEEVVQDALEAMPPAPEALKELVQLPNAEDVFYHLAQHPDELDKITALTPMGQALEFGKISARLAARSKVAVSVTKAKPSPQPPRGEGGKFTSEGDAAYEKLLKAARNPWN